MKKFEKILKYSMKHNGIYCYGAGKYGKIVGSFLLANGVNIVAFVETKVTKGKGRCLGIPIIQIDNIRNDTDYVGIIVCAGNKYRKEMECELVRRNIVDYAIMDDNMIDEMDKVNSYDIKFVNPDQPRILLYHRVADLETDIWNLAVSPKMFEMHIKYLSENYDIVRFEDIGKTDNSGVVITFDDGYVDNYNNALPILEKFRVPATFFISTGNIGSDREFWWDELERCVYLCGSGIYTVVFGDKEYRLNDAKERLVACREIRLQILKMEPEQREEAICRLLNDLKDIGIAREGYRSMNINELMKMDASPYVTIGAHTVTHSRLTSESREQQKYEMVESQKVLENLLGHKVETFSFPFGGENDYDKDVIRIAKEAGYNRVAAVRKQYYDVKSRVYNYSRIVMKEPENADSCIKELRRSICLD